jgi:hypothetical protein
MKCLVGSMNEGYDVPIPMADMMINIGVLVFNWVAVVLFWGIYGRYKKKTTEYIKQRLVISSTVLLYMMYPNFIKLFFQLFSCKSYPPEIIRRLQGSMDTICFDDDHMFWIWRLALPVLLMIVIPWPVSSVLKLNHLRKTKEKGLANTDVVSTFGFLFDGFKLDCWYWEIIVLARKVSLSIVSVFLSITNNNINTALYRQGMAAVFIMVTSLCVHLCVYPYADLQINRLEAMGLTVSALTLYGGMLTFEGATSGVVKNMISITVLGMNLIWLLFVLKIMYSGLKVYNNVIKFCCCCFRKKGKKAGAGESSGGDGSEGNKLKGSKGKDSSKSKSGKVMNDIEMTPVDVSNPLVNISTTMNPADGDESPASSSKRDKDKCESKGSRSSANITKVNINRIEGAATTTTAEKNHRSIMINSQSKGHKPKPST